MAWIDEAVVELAGCEGALHGLDLRIALKRI